jgi:hypothetical protein
VIEGGEACDGAALGGENCHSQGRETGVLACQDCQFDFSGCGPLIYGSGADGNAFVPGEVNLSQASLVPTRTCEDAVAYAVVNLGDTWAEVDGVIATDCLAAGDQVLLINLQGANPSQVGNVGKREILEVLEVTGSTVVFTQAKEYLYGDNGSDTNIGTGANMHRVVVQRVPQYESLTIQGSGRLTVDPYDCASHTGGVLAVKVSGTATFVGGEVDVTELGYGGGQRWNDQNGAQGDSYGGDCILTDDHNETPNLGGGGGGLCNTSRTGCTVDGCPGGGGGAGHRNPGTDGDMIAWRGLGGNSYGTQFPDRIFLGSGGGAGGECASGGTAGSGGRGGGIIILLATDIVGSGIFRADGQPGLPASNSGGGGGGSGGSIYVRGESIQASFAANASASGGSGGSGGGGFSGGPGSEGRVTFLE